MSGFSRTRKSVASGFSRTRKSVASGFSRTRKSVASGFSRTRKSVASGFSRTRKSVASGFSRTRKSVASGFSRTRKSVASGFSRTRKSVVSGFSRTRKSVASGFSRTASAERRERDPALPIPPHAHRQTGTSRRLFLRRHSSIFPDILHKRSETTVHQQGRRRSGPRANFARCNRARIRGSCVLLHARSRPPARGSAGRTFGLQAVHRPREAVFGVLLLEAIQAALWQRYSFEHVVRDNERSTTIARYILQNPVRAGLVTSIADYPFVGSLVWPMPELLEWMMTDGFV